jgi:hypothetical protein
LAPTDFAPRNDVRLPSGVWSGFYLEDQRPRRGWMHLYLTFEDGVIAGEGTDYVGPWNISGSYDAGTGYCHWVKQYLGKHQVVYDGKVTDNGIEGVWNIRNWLNGQFHIWPRHRHDLEQLYLSDENDGFPPTILGGTVPIPPDI